MSSSSPLRPTLWRTCRVLASHTRLEIFRLLLLEPDQTVSGVAAHFHLPLPIASQYLRALEARGLLAARRRGRWVTYRPSPATKPNAPSGLLAALKAAFQEEPEPVPAIVKIATAFTHPRRIEIYRALQAGERTAAQLRACTRISSWALSRHLKKLEARGLVVRRGGLYGVPNNLAGLQGELARMATA